MTQQVIDIGSTPDDDSGDPLRTSFDKTNDNFTELYAKGATEGLWNYNKTSTDTSTTPVSGRFKTNSGNYRDATQIAIHAITVQGIDRSSTLRTLLVGDLIQCQDKSNAAAWCRYSLQSLPVDHGTWFQLNVTFQADGGVASGDNQEIIFVFTASSGSTGGGAPIGAEYITSTADATLTAERVLTDTATVTWDRTTAGQIKAIAAGGSSIVTAPQGRLTLQSGTPVMTTTQAGKTTIFFSPYVGDQVPLWDGTAFTRFSVGELSALTTDTTKSPAAIGASKVNDWFVWNDGVFRLSHGPDWTSDTVRSAGTALVMVNGIWLNNASITNGPAAQRGTYVGTTCSDGASQLSWTYGSSAVGGSSAFFGVWNCYNRVTIATKVADSTASWSSVANTVRAANGSTQNRVSFILGLAENVITASYLIQVFGSSVSVIAGVGLDSITAFTGTTGYSVMISGDGAFVAGQVMQVGSLGQHFVQALEWANGIGGTWFGDGSSGGVFQNGLLFNMQM